MIHRSLGPRLAWGLAFSSAIGSTDDARACLTTTCAVKNAPPECMRDFSTSCWTAGIPLQWREPCVSFSVDARGIPEFSLDYAGTEGLVVSSFALWPQSACTTGFPSISVQSAGPARCARVEYSPEGPNSNSVIFQSENWSHDAIALGVTTVSFNVETGRIVDADIEVNLASGNLNFLGIRYVVAHEAGHFFGIDHSADGTALMYSQSSGLGFEVEPLLTPDDQNAMCAAYPTLRPVGVCDFEPERGYSNTCGGDIEGSCAVNGSSATGRPGAPFGLFLATLVAWMARTRRTRLRSSNA
jgi:hypothetical protein